MIIIPGNPYKYWVFGASFCLEVHERYMEACAFSALSLERVEVTGGLYTFVLKIPPCRFVIFLNASIYMFIGIGHKRVFQMLNDKTPVQ